VTNDQTHPSAAGRRVLSRRKRVFFLFVLFALLTLFVECSLQIFYRVSVGRWLWEWWALPIFEQDPIRVYRLKPNLDFLHQTREFTARYCTDESGMRVECGQPGPVVAKGVLARATCPAGKARVAPLRWTQDSRPSTSSLRAMLWLMK